MTEPATHVDAPAPGVARVEPAGRWQRLAAFTIDTVLTVAAVVALTLPWVREVAAYLGAQWTGLPTPPATVLLGLDDTPPWWRHDIEAPLLVVVGTWFVVTALYQVVFLRLRGATPGKLALGLRVRLLERPGPLPVRAIVRRVLVQLVPVLLAVTPYCSALGRLVPLLGAFAVLTDDHRRAWHDVAAGTCVVRGRGSAAAWDAPPTDGVPPPPAW